MNQLTIVNLLLHSPKDGKDGAYDNGIIGFPVQSISSKVGSKMVWRQFVSQAKAMVVSCGDDAQ